MTGSISKHACCCVCIRCLLPWAAHNIQDSRTDTIKPPQHRATHTLLQPSLTQSRKQHRQVTICWMHQAWTTNARFPVRSHAARWLLLYCSPKQARTTTQSWHAGWLCTNAVRVLAPTGIPASLQGKANINRNMVTPRMVYKTVTCAEG